MHLYSLPGANVNYEELLGGLVLAWPGLDYHHDHYQRQQTTFISSWLAVVAVQMYPEAEVCRPSHASNSTVVDLLKSFLISIKKF